MKSPNRPKQLSANERILETICQANALIKNYRDILDPTKECPAFSDESYIESPDLTAVFGWVNITYEDRKDDVMCISTVMISVMKYIIHYYRKCEHFRATMEAGLVAGASDIGTLILREAVNDETCKRPE